MTSDARSRAWDAIHAALPDGWHVAPPSYDPGRRAWTAVARGPLPVGRRGRPEYVEAEGEDEIAALTYLALALRERRNAETLTGLRKRTRLAYLEGAEEESRRVTGRPMTHDELERVIQVVPGYREGRGRA